MHHTNVCNLIGLCIEHDTGTVWQLSSYAEFGDLSTFVGDVAMNRSLLSRETLQDWSAQMAHGMVFLHKMGVVHQNLSSRNVLLFPPRATTPGTAAATPSSSSSPTLSFSSSPSSSFSPSMPSSSTPCPSMPPQSCARSPPPPPLPLPPASSSPASPMSLSEVWPDASCAGGGPAAVLMIADYTEPSPRHDYQESTGEATINGWMSPERAEAGIRSQQGDVWAFGIILWQMATTEHPGIHGGRTTGTAAAAAAAAGAAAVGRPCFVDRPVQDPFFAGVVERCCRKHPQDRSA